jgi:hypothetical protein
MTKRTIRVDTGFDKYEIDSKTLNQVIATLKVYRERVGGEAVFDINVYSEYDCEMVDINLYEERIETDEEYSIRARQEAAQQARYSQQKIEQYEKLKKELGYV